MFKKGPIKGDGIDITIKNNPDHFLAPNDWDMVLKARFGKISTSEYKQWYLNLLRSRWETRKEEFKELALQGANKDVKLKCYCSSNSPYCHAKIAAEFMNALVKKLSPAAA